MLVHECASLGAVWVCGSALAGFVDPNDVFTVELSFGDTAWSTANNPMSVTNFFLNDQGQWVVEGQWQTANWASDWAFQIDQGSASARGGGLLETGFVVSSFNFTNTTGMDTAFTLNITANVTALSQPTVMTGSLSGSLGSGNPLVETAELGVPTGGFLYEALADGMVVRSLVDDSFSASTNLTTAFGSFGFADEVGPAVASTLGINHNFTLTDGDNVNFVGSFIVEEIPAPGGVALFGVAGLALARRRR